MAAPRQMTILHVSAVAMPAMITRLTTYLLQDHYMFLQTRYDTTRVGFEIFTAQEQLLLRLTLQTTESTTSVSRLPTTRTPLPLAAEATRLLQHLLQLG